MGDSPSSFLNVVAFPQVGTTPKLLVAAITVGLGTPRPAGEPNTQYLKAFYLVLDLKGE